MKFYKSLLVAAFVISAFGQGFAQSSTQADVTRKTASYLAEVYKGMPEFSEADRIAAFAEMLGRIEVREEAPVANEDYIKLSSIALVDKYNPEIRRDNHQNFQPENFNPFKYFLDFHPKKERKYRVDNTAYVIVISPKK
jgi:hypothetical protein